MSWDNNFEGICCLLIEGKKVEAREVYDSAIQRTTTVPPHVRIALRVLLRHVEPNWDNCKAVVQDWLEHLP